MKPALAHLSPTVPAAFATAVAISLSGFLLASAGVQGEPVPLLPAVGDVAGSVIADLPTPANKHASERVTRAARSAEPPTATPEASGLHRRAGVSEQHRVRSPARVVRRAAPARVQTPAPAATPVRTRTFPKTLAAKGKAVGHGHGHSHAHAPSPSVGTRVHGHGKAGGHHRGLPPGHAKKAPAAPDPARATPPKANGGGAPADHGAGNGHDGGKK